MRVSFFVYVLTDAKGNKEARVVNSPGDTMPPIYGYNKGGSWEQYDSYEAWHLADWARARGMSVECSEHSIEI